MSANDQLILCQIDLEKTYSKKNTIPYIRTLIGDNAEINAHVQELENALNQWTPTDDMADGMELIVEELLTIDLRDAVYNATAYVMSKNGQVCTIQEVIGTQLGAVSHLENLNHKLIACTYIVACVCKFKYIRDQVRKGYQTLIRSDFRFNEEVMENIKTQGYVLPSIVPLKKITNNSQSGYQTFEKSVMLGGKHHNKFVCLSHINKVNATPYQYETRLREITEPVFSEEPEVKKDGHWETPEDIEKRREAFTKLHTSLPERIDAIQNISNVFYLAHGYCTRGRTHVNAYDYNYQGTKFLKGMIDLAELELIKPDF